MHLDKHENILPGVLIYKTCMFLEVQRSHDDEYVIFKSIKLDDTPIKNIGEVVKKFIM